MWKLESNNNKSNCLVPMERVYSDFTINDTLTLTNIIYNINKNSSTIPTTHYSNYLSGGRSKSRADQKKKIQNTNHYFMWIVTIVLEAIHSLAILASWQRTLRCSYPFSMVRYWSSLSDRRFGLGNSVGNSRYLFRVRLRAWRSARVFRPAKLIDCQTPFMPLPARWEC